MLDLLTPQEAAFRSRVAELAARCIAPHAERADGDSALPPESWRALADEGLLGITVPRRWGGLELGLLEMSVALEEVAAACASTALSYGAHAILCTHNLQVHGSDAQRERFLPGLASGRLGGAFALTEPGAGSDATGLSTRAVRDGDHYVLSGSKTFITNGPFADVFLLFARTAPEPGARSLSAFVVERTAPGFAVARDLKKLGFRGSPTSELMFDHCRIPVANRLGEEGDGIRIMMASLDVERALMSTIPLGMARRALDLTRDHIAATAGANGRAGGASQESMSLLADMLVGVEALRGLSYRAIRCLERGERATVPASCAKLYGAEMVMQTASAAVDLTATAPAPVRRESERIFRDAKLIAIGAGSSQIQKLILAREMLAPK